MLLLKWQVLREIVYLLEIPLRAIVAIQRQDLTLSDVFGIWMKMKIHLQACINRGIFKTGISRKLFDSLEARKKFIFNNRFMGAALFLDPRYRRFLINDAIEFEKAKQTLVSVWNRLSADDGRTTEIENVNTIEPAEDDFDIKFDENAELNKMIFDQNESAMNITRDQSGDIEFSLDMFAPEAITSESSILEYWSREEKNHPDLYRLAMVVFAVSPTEVQIERDFSRLNFVFTDRRCSIQAERLEDIMIIHINSEVFQEVKKEIIDSYKKEINV